MLSPSSFWAAKRPHTSIIPICDSGPFRYLFLRINSILVELSSRLHCGFCHHTPSTIQPVHHLSACCYVIIFVASKALEMCLPSSDPVVDLTNFDVLYLIQHVRHCFIYFDEHNTIMLPHWFGRNKLIFWFSLVPDSRRVSKASLTFAFSVVVSKSRMPIRALGTSTRTLPLSPTAALGASLSLSPGMSKL